MRTLAWEKDKILKIIKQKYRPVNNYKENSILFWFWSIKSNLDVKFLTVYTYVQTISFLKFVSYIYSFKTFILAKTLNGNLNKKKFSYQKS